MLIAQLSPTLTLALTLTNAYITAVNAHPTAQNNHHGHSSLFDTTLRFHTSTHHSHLIVHQQTSVHNCCVYVCHRNADTPPRHRNLLSQSFSFPNRPYKIPHSKCYSIPNLPQWTLTSQLYLRLSNPAAPQLHPSKATPPKVPAVPTAHTPPTPPTSPPYPPAAPQPTPTSSTSRPTSQQTTTPLSLSPAYKTPSPQPSSLSPPPHSPRSSTREPTHSKPYSGKKTFNSSSGAEASKSLFVCPLNKLLQEQASKQSTLKPPP
jgi:hypothetical protein